MRAEGQTLRNLANAHHELGSAARSRELYEEALELQERIGDRPGVMATRMNLAVALRQLHVSRGRRLVLRPHRSVGPDIGPDIVVEG